MNGAGNLPSPQVARGDSVAMDSGIDLDLDLEFDLGFKRSFKFEVSTFSYHHENWSVARTVPGARRRERPDRAPPDEILS